jgi:hypothetical protein
MGHLLVLANDVRRIEEILLCPSGAQSLYEGPLFKTMVVEVPRLVWHDTPEPLQPSPPPREH